MLYELDLMEETRTQLQEEAVASSHQAIGVSMKPFSQWTVKRQLRRSRALVSRVPPIIIDTHSLTHPHRLYMQRTYAQQYEY